MRLGVIVLVGLGLGWAAASVALASPPLPVPLNEVLVVGLAGKGVELRPAQARVRALQDGLRACVDPMAPTRGALTVVVSLRKRVVADVEVSGTLEATHGACVAAVFKGLVLEPAAAKAELTARLLVRPLVNESALPEIEARDELVLADDFSCVGLGEFVCAPNKSCAAAPRRKVRCPSMHGVPARTTLGDRRVVLRVSGGKTGQLGETLIVAEGDRQCRLVVMTNVGDADMLSGRSENREDVDVPCARARAVFALAARAGLAGLRKPKATSHDHEVTHRWQLWQPGRGDIPTVREGGWSGDSPKAQVVWNKVGAALVALAHDYATLQPGRF